MKTAITISISVKPRLATGRIRPTRRGTSPPDSPPDESVRLADSRVGGQRRIGQVTPCAPNHKARNRTPNPKLQLLPAAACNLSITANDADSSDWGSSRRGDLACRFRRLAGSMLPHPFSIAARNRRKMFALITHVIEQFFRFAQAGIERFGIYAVALSKASRLD